MKKILSVLLLAAACILSGCEPKEPEVEKAKFTVVNNRSHDIFVMMYLKYDDSYYIIHEDITSGGSIVKYVEPGTYHFIGTSSMPIYVKEYDITIENGEEKTISFR